MKPIILFFILISVQSCSFFDSFTKKTEGPLVAAPTFDADYAYQMIEKYEKFGPKVPGTAEHQKAGDWLLTELQALTPTVHEQKASATTFDQKKIPIRNLIAQFNPNAKKRYLLSAHWDNRPFADQDPKFYKKAVPGVNDGGSGVVVLLTIGKALQPLFAKGDLSFGVDLALWDSEDWGTPSIPDSYCLGSQYFGKNPIPANYRAEFGINFDMVGRKGSIFPIDIYSEQKAPLVMKGFRSAATKLGYGAYFPESRIGPIVDDHYFISEALNIPMIDIIYMTPEGRFAPEWHTVQDTSEHISRDVLKVVGQTTLQLLFSQ
jgi:glutaminyl-peptide cyclotransferase